MRFAKSRDVEDERVAICTFLKQLDPVHVGAYGAEIREITRGQSISQGLQQELSKIWIDQEPLKNWAEKHVQEARFRALCAAGTSSPAKSTQSPSKGSVMPQPASDVPEVPADELGALLMRIVSQFVYQSFMHRQHGLDS